MKKVLNLRICEKFKAGEGCIALTLEDLNGEILPPVQPGQFINIAVDNCKDVYLRRPISISNVTANGRQWHLLVRIAGKGTSHLAQLKVGDVVNIVGPLGCGFSLENVAGRRFLLIGGGVGVAPLLYYGKCLKENGADVVFLLGARSINHLYLPGHFSEVATTCIATEDGTAGIRGFVTDNIIINDHNFDSWAVCGPAPMMKAVARKARENDMECYVSLENMMACGLGACLCCVEKTVQGNICVCTNGPVFNINELTW